MGWCTTRKGHKTSWLGTHTHISFTFVLQVMEKAVGGVASWVYDLFAANGYNHGKKLFKVGHNTYNKGLLFTEC